VPEFIVTSPDGTKYRVRGPDGATQQDALKQVQQKLGAPDPGSRAVPSVDPDAQPDDRGLLGRGLDAANVAAGNLNMKIGDAVAPALRFTRGGGVENPPPRSPTAPSRAEISQPKEEGLDEQELFDWRSKLKPGTPEYNETTRKLAKASKQNADEAVLFGLPGAAVGKGVAGLVERGAGAAGKRLPTLQSGATKATEALRSGATAGAGKTAQEETAAAAAQQRKGQAVERAQAQLGRAPAVAEQRAQRAAQAPPMEAERQRVLANMRERVRVLQNSYQEAGLNVGQAQHMVGIAERKIQDGEVAVGQLERELLTRPTMAADEFGQRVRTITQEINDKYSRIRSQQSGFREAIEGAGDAPRINTAPTQALIDQHLKDVRNPGLQRVLGGLRDLVETEGKPALSVRAADSARGYLDSVIQSKMFGETKLDRETLFVVRQIKKALVEAATTGWAPYRAALAKWRTLSRPLDIVERKGALRKVIDADPVSTDYALTEAQVVGRVIAGARSGGPGLTRLVAESPEMKDAARLYFTHDLFAKEAVPTEASLRTWLKNNEAPLRQIGLYSEFRDIRAAREAATRAASEAKGARAGSVAQLRAAEQAERAAAEQLATAERLRQKQQTRIADAERAAGRTDYRVLSTKRVEAASSRLEGQKKGAQAEQAKRLATADRYKQFESEIKVARPEEVPTQTRAFVKRLRDDGKLTDGQYEQRLKQIQDVEDKITDRAERVRRIKQIAKYAALAGMGYGGYRAASTVMGGR
jgi:hypothetical protein